MIKPADILRGKILVVDDQEANVRLLEQLLRGAGYESVASTIDSSKVCELHLVSRYDLIVLDLQMPGMDGFQVMENLRALEPDGYLPVLVITAQPQHKLRALKSGARDFVSKPFDVAEVLARVHNLLEVRLLHLETRKLYERVVTEQKVSERVLLGAAREPTAEQVGPGPKAPAAVSAGQITEGYAELTVLFVDLLALTNFSQGASARVLTGVLNDVSTRLEAGAGKADVERTRIVGDALLASSGLPDNVADHTIRAANMALDLAETVKRFNVRSAYKLKVRIGFETKGRVGKRKVMHDL